MTKDLINDMIKIVKERERCKMSKVKVILNVQHSLLDNQRKILDDKFGKDNWMIFPVAADGWTASQQVDIASQLVKDSSSVVFASPVPYLLKTLSISSALMNDFYVYIFHNDNRDKKQLPDGRVVYTVKDDGWVLI